MLGRTGKRDRQLTVAVVVVVVVVEEVVEEVVVVGGTPLGQGFTACGGELELLLGILSCCGGREGEGASER